MLYPFELRALSLRIFLSNDSKFKLPTKRLLCPPDFFPPVPTVRLRNESYELLPLPRAADCFKGGVAGSLRDYELMVTDPQPPFFSREVMLVSRLRILARDTSWKPTNTTWW